MPRKTAKTLLNGPSTRLAREDVFCFKASVARSCTFRGHDSYPVDSGHGLKTMNDLLRVGSRRSQVSSTKLTKRVRVGSRSAISSRSPPDPDSGHPVESVCSHLKEALIYPEPVKYSSHKPRAAMEANDLRLAGLRTKKKQTRRGFLAEMEKVVPWAALLAAIEPHYPTTGRRGRPPIPLDNAAIYFMQQWYALSDPAMEDALYEIEVDAPVRGTGPHGRCRCPTRRPSSSSATCSRSTG